MTYEKKKQLQRILLTIFPLIILLFCFAFWLLRYGTDNVISVLAALVTAFLLAEIIIRLVPQWQRTWSGESMPEVCYESSKRLNRKSYLHPIAKILLFALLSRILLFLLSYVISVYINGYTGPFPVVLKLWNPESGNLALDIAKKGYNLSIGQSIFSVMPLYPLLTALFSLLVRSSILAGLLVSNLAFLLSCCFLYELVIKDGDRNTGIRAVAFLCLLPPTVLLSCTGPASLFLLFSILTALMTRKRKYVLSAVFGMFATLTHICGVLLFIPVVIELTSDCISDSKFTESAGELLKAYIPKYLSLLLIPAVFFAYLFVTKPFTGSLFGFLPYANSTYTGFHLTFDTASKVTSELIASAYPLRISELTGTGIPNFIFFFLSLVCILPVVPKMRTSVIVYAILYFCIVFSLGNHMQIPLMFICCYPFPISMALYTKKKWAGILFVLLTVLFCLAYLIAFTCGWTAFTGVL